MTTGEREERPTAAPESSPVFLSLVIPAYNEERRLPNTLDRILDFLKTQDYAAEILVVENASTDRTWEIADAASRRDDRIRVFRETTRGKGAAVRKGMLEARGTYRFLCDADLSMPIEEVVHFLPPALEHTDVAIASREAAGAVRYDEPERRHVMGRVFNRLVRLLLIGEIQDTQCGFKCFGAEAAEEIFRRVTRTGFSYDVEALVIAERLGYRVAEIPVPWHYDSDSRVRMIGDSFAMVLDLLAIWLLSRRGRYD